MKKLILILILLIPDLLFAGSDGGIPLVLEKIIQTKNKTIMIFHNLKNRDDSYYKKLYTKCNKITLELKYTRFMYLWDKIRSRAYSKYEKHFEDIKKANNYLNKKLQLDIYMEGSPSGEDIDQDRCLIKASWLIIYGNTFYPRRY